jgi:hypothetical protein
MKLDKWLSRFEPIMIIVFAIIPLFLTFPYRVNIFLTWEGAYRMSNGELPFRDFGIPMGYMFWTLPALFFKLLGPQMVTLVKAQVVINIMSGLAFRSILRTFAVPPGIRFTSVLMFLISFSFINFWPWYNHTVIVYELVSLAFLSAYLVRGKKSWQLVLAALFGFMSFFTKQDGGGLCLLISLTLLGYDAIVCRDRRSLPIYIIVYILISLLFMLPLSGYGFSYWFNHGQPPHTSRVSVTDIFSDLLFESQALKISLILVITFAVSLFTQNRKIFMEKDKALFLLLTLGIIAQAVIMQVTSYTPPNNNIYFQSFVFAWVLTAMSLLLPLPWNHPLTLVSLCIALLFWKSDVYAGYVSRRFFSKADNSGFQLNEKGENIVNRSNYLQPKPTSDIKEWQWIQNDLPVFKKITMPPPTVEGINRLMNMDLVKSGKLKVLNMTELTPLAAVLPYEHEKGVYTPLWNHLGVSMFNKQAETYEKKISARYYDLVLFEYIPGLNNFFPFRVRDSLQVYYRKVDSFYAPRRGPETMGNIEVYRR